MKRTVGEVPCTGLRSVWARGHCHRRPSTGRIAPSRTPTRREEQRRSNGRKGLLARRPRRVSSFPRFRRRRLGEREPGSSKKQLRGGGRVQSEGDLVEDYVETRFGLYNAKKKKGWFHVLHLSFSKTQNENEIGTVNFIRSSEKTLFFLSDSEQGARLESTDTRRRENTLNRVRLVLERSCFFAFRVS